MPNGADELTECQAVNRPRESASLRISKSREHARHSPTVSHINLWRAIIQFKAISIATEMEAVACPTRITFLCAAFKGDNGGGASIEFNIVLFFPIFFLFIYFGLQFALIFGAGFTGKYLIRMLMLFSPINSHRSSDNVSVASDLTRMYVSDEDEKHEFRVPVPHYH